MTHIENVRSTEDNLASGLPRRLVTYVENVRSTEDNLASGLPRRLVTYVENVVLRFVIGAGGQTFWHPGYQRIYPMSSTPREVPRIFCNFEGKNNNFPHLRGIGFSHVEVPVFFLICVCLPIASCAPRHS